MKQFDLNEQWRLYLQRMGLSEERMHPIQLQETKRAFMGACGQMLILLTDDLPGLTKPDALRAVEGMIKQAKAFWQTEISKQN